MARQGRITPGQAAAGKRFSQRLERATPKKRKVIVRREVAKHPQPKRTPIPAPRPTLQKPGYNLSRGQRPRAPQRTVKPGPARIPEPTAEVKRVLQRRAGTEHQVQRARKYQQGVANIYKAERNVYNRDVDDLFEDAVKKTKGMDYPSRKEVEATLGDRNKARRKLAEYDPKSKYWNPAKYDEHVPEYLKAAAPTYAPAVLNHRGQFDKELKIKNPNLRQRVGQNTLKVAGQALKGVTGEQVEQLTGKKLPGPKFLKKLGSTEVIGTAIAGVATGGAALTARAAGGSALKAAGKELLPQFRGTRALGRGIFKPGQTAARRAAARKGISVAHPVARHRAYAGAIAGEKRTKRLAKLEALEKNPPQGKRGIFGPRRTTDINKMDPDQRKWHLKYRGDKKAAEDKRTTYHATDAKVEGELVPGTKGTIGKALYSGHQEKDLAGVEYYGKNVHRVRVKDNVEIVDLDAAPTLKSDLRKIAHSQGPEAATELALANNVRVADVTLNGRKVRVFYDKTAYKSTPHVKPSVAPPKTPEVRARARLLAEERGTADIQTQLKIAKGVAGVGLAAGTEQGRNIVGGTGKAIVTNPGKVGKSSIAGLLATVGIPYSLVAAGASGGPSDVKATFNEAIIQGTKEMFETYAHGSLKDIEKATEDYYGLLPAASVALGGAAVRKAVNDHATRQGKKYPAGLIKKLKRDHPEIFDPKFVKSPRKKGEKQIQINPLAVPERRRQAVRVAEQQARGRRAAQQESPEAVPHLKEEALRTLPPNERESAVALQAYGLSPNRLEARIDLDSKLLPIAREQAARGKDKLAKVPEEVRTQLEHLEFLRAATDDAAQWQRLSAGADAYARSGKELPQGVYGQRGEASPFITRALAEGKALPHENLRTDIREGMNVGRAIQRAAKRPVTRARRAIVDSRAKLTTLKTRAREIEKRIAAIDSGAQRTFKAGQRPVVPKAVSDTAVNQARERVAAAAAAEKVIYQEAKKQSLAEPGARAAASRRYQKAVERTRAAQTTLDRLVRENETAKRIAGVSAKEPKGSVRSRAQRTRQAQRARVKAQTEYAAVTRQIRELERDLDSGNGGQTARGKLQMALDTALETARGERARGKEAITFAQTGLSKAERVAAREEGRYKVALAQAAEKRIATHTQSFVEQMVQGFESRGARLPVYVKHSDISKIADEVDPIPQVDVPSTPGQSHDKLSGGVLQRQGLVDFGYTTAVQARLNSVHAHHIGTAVVRALHENMVPLSRGRGEVASPFVSVEQYHAGVKAGKIDGDVLPVPVSHLRKYAHLDERLAAMFTKEFGVDIRNPGAIPGGADARVLVRGPFGQQLYNSAKKLDPFTRTFRHLTHQSSLILLGMNPTWAAFQIAAEGIPLALGRGGIHGFVRAARKWDQLSESRKRAVDVMAGAVNPTRKGEIVNQIRHEDDIIVAKEALEELEKAEAAPWNIDPRLHLIHLDRLRGNYYRRNAWTREIDRSINTYWGRQKNVFGLTKKAMDELQNLPFDEQVRYFTDRPELAEAITREVDGMLGEWTALTRTEQQISSFVMFYPFLRYSIRFVFRTFPKQHPAKAMIAAHLGAVGARGLKELLGETDYSFINQAAAGIIYHSDGSDPDIRSVARMTPVGNALLAMGADPSFDVKGLAATNPAFSAFMAAFTGQDPLTGIRYRPEGSEEHGGKTLDVETGKDAMTLGTRAHIALGLLLHVPYPARVGLPKRTGFGKVKGDAPDSSKLFDTENQRRLKALLGGGAIIGTPATTQKDRNRYFFLRDQIAPIAGLNDWDIRVKRVSEGGKITDKRVDQMIKYKAELDILNQKYKLGKYSPSIQKKIKEQGGGGSGGGLGGLGGGGLGGLGGLGG